MAQPRFEAHRMDRYQMEALLDKWFYEHKLLDEEINALISHARYLEMVVDETLEYHYSHWRPEPTCCATLSSQYANARLRQAADTLAHLVDSCQTQDRLHTLHRDFLVFLEMWDKARNEEIRRLWELLGRSDYLIAQAQVALLPTVKP